MADTGKVRQIVHDVADDYTNKLEELHRRGHDIEVKIPSVQTRLTNYLKDKCYTQFEWIEGHSKVTETKRDFGIVMNENVNKKEADRNLSEFHECCERNNLGLGMFFEDKSIERDMIQLNHEKCLQNCTKDNILDEEIKTCVSYCFKNTITSMNRLFNDIDQKVSEINNKI